MNIGLGVEVAAVCRDWCYRSLPTYRDRSRHWRRPFQIHRLAAENRRDVMANYVSWDSSTMYIGSLWSSICYYGNVAQLRSQRAV
jgi:hypothetical protein